MSFFMGITATVIGLLLTAGSVFGQIGLISPEEVQRLAAGEDPSKRPLILDTRGGYKDYISGHIPGARHINFDTLRGTDERGIPVQYLPEDMTRNLLERAGVDRNRTHILYAEGGAGDEILSSSMVAYVLEKYGVQNIQLVDGGLPDFKAKFALSQQYPLTTRGQLPSQTRFEIGVDVETVLKKKDLPKVVLVDARPRDEYLGEDKVWPRKGHIPGAVSFPWRQVMTESNTHKFKPFTEIEPLLTKAGITKDKEVIVYCGTSREGSLLRYYFKHIAKFENVVLYEGSWKEYSALTQYPAETKVPRGTKS